MIEYKYIEDFNNKYCIYEDGRVLSMITGKILRPCLINGYKQVILRKENKSHHLYIHRLLAIHFIPNEEKKPFINHIDGNRSNNLLSNLEWCTQKENLRHAHASGLVKTRTGLGRSTLSEEVRNEINTLRRSGLSQSSIAKTYKTDQGTISRIVNNKI